MSVWFVVCVGCWMVGCLLSVWVIVAASTVVVCVVVCLFGLLISFGWIVCLFICVCSCRGGSLVDYVLANALW